MLLYKDVILTRRIMLSFAEGGLKNEYKSAGGQ
jgi:hypothetical protein